MEGITSPPTLQSATKNSFFTPLLISMLGILVSSMAIVAYHLLLVKYCIRRHASSSTTTGVEARVLKTIPIFAFSAVKNDQIEECVVCLGELEDEDIVRLLPNCKHAFHVACIDQWLAAHVSCPLCRSPILEQITSAQTLNQNTAGDSDCGGSNESNATEGEAEQPSRREGSSSSLEQCAPKERRSWSQLKRSLSVDVGQVVIDVHRDEYRSCSSGSRGRLTRSGSWYLDRVSSKWLWSFSRLRTGKGLGTNAATLPY